MARSDSLTTGSLFGLTLFVAAAIAAPKCYNVVYDSCTPNIDCGVAGTSITVCESNWPESTTGMYKGPVSSQPQKCYTFTNTTRDNCNNSPSGMAKIPNCTMIESSLCCFYSTSNPPTVTNGPVNIMRPTTLAFCLSTTDPVPVVP